IARLRKLSISQMVLYPAMETTKSAASIQPIMSLLNSWITSPGWAAPRRMRRRFCSDISGADQQRPDLHPPGEMTESVYIVGQQLVAIFATAAGHQHQMFVVNSEFSPDLLARP